MTEMSPTPETHTNVPSRNSIPPVVAITGGSRGLGYALAENLLKAGFAVSVCARSNADLKRVEKSLRELGPVFAMAVDLSDDIRAAEWMTRTVATFGRLDALVHNASTLGDLPMPKLAETSTENLHRVYHLNAVAPILLTQTALPALSRQQKALLVTISSDAAIGGYPSWGVYGASKAALDLLTRTLSHELAGNSIWVTSVDPGDMDTLMHRQAAPEDTGLPAPSAAARAMLPLFLPLLDECAVFPYRSGTRFVVTHGTNGSYLSPQPVQGGENECAH